MQAMRSLRIVSQFFDDHAGSFCSESISDAPGGPQAVHRAGGLRALSVQIARCSQLECEELQYSLQALTAVLGAVDSSCEQVDQVLRPLLKICVSTSPHKNATAAAKCMSEISNQMTPPSSSTQLQSVKDERCVYALLEIQRSLSEKARRSTHLWLQSLIAKIQRSNRRGRFALLIGNDRVDSAHSWRSSAMHHADMNVRSLKRQLQDYGFELQLLHGAWKGNDACCPRRL